MRSVSNRNNSGYSSTTTSTTGKSTRSSSGLYVSQFSNKNNSASSSGALNSAKIAQTRTNYTAIKKAADSLQTHATNLMATGKDSLFDKAIQADSSNSTETQLSQNKSALYKEISSFVDDYNTMVKNMNTAGGSLNNLYLKQIKGFAAASQSALSKAGLKQKTDGTLALNQKTMKSADLEDLQKVFGSKGSFADKVSAKSITVESNASTSLNSLNNISGYNQYGSLTDLLTNSGSRLNSKG